MEKLQQKQDSGVSNKKKCCLHLDSRSKNATHSHAFTAANVLAIQCMPFTLLSMTLLVHKD